MCKHKLARFQAKPHDHWNTVEVRAGLLRGEQTDLKQTQRGNKAADKPNRLCDLCFPPDPKVHREDW